MNKLIHFKKYLFYIFIIINCIINGCSSLKKDLTEDLLTSFPMLPPDVSKSLALSTVNKFPSYFVR